VNPNIDAFNNMSPISVPRLLTLLVSDIPETRVKANWVLRSISRASSTESVIDGLVIALGLQEVASLANFFMDWASKEAMTELELGLLKQFASALRVDSRLKADFAKKITPILKPIIDDKKRPDQMVAVELSAMILT
jgi:hypothetical protein